MSEAAMNSEGESSTVVSFGSARSQMQVVSDKTNSIPHRASMEKIGSVQENPFYTRFGLRQAATTPRNRYGADPPSSARRLSSNGSIGDGEEVEQLEYKPGSGFVHKLLDRWSHLNAREEPVTSQTLLKKASSLEDLPAEDEAPKASLAMSRVTNLNSVSKKPTSLLAPKLAHRAQSIESLSLPPRKSHSNHHKASHHLRHVESAWQKKEPAPPLKSPRGSHIVAPDVDLARDDIIIIEKTPQPQSEDAAVSEDESESSEGSPPLSYREEILPNELPKPNTVQTVRNIFETNSSLPSSNNLFHLKKKPVDTSPVFSQSSTLATSSSQVETTQITSPNSTESGVSIRGFSPAASPRRLSSDSYAKPILSPPAINPPSLSWKLPDHSKPVTDSFSSSLPTSNSNSLRLGGNSVSRSSGIQDKTSSLSSVASVSDSSTIPASTEAKPSSVLERSNFFESPRLGEVRPTPSPRSMASVRPTIASKPSPAVKPLPISAPASAATSYKPSSPVVPVAPFKDKKDDGKDDDQPVMIFSKSRLSPKREKIPRINDYAPINEPPKGVPTDSVSKKKDDLIINKDSKVLLKDRKLKTESQVENKPVSLKNTVTERKSAEREGDKIIQTPQQTTIQIGLTRKADHTTSGDNKHDKSTTKDQELVSPRVLGGKKTQAPSVPGVEKVKTQKAPLPPERKENQPQSMIYISSSESGESDSSTPPETPRTSNDTKPTATLEGKVSAQESIRGVPSLITVSRLKQDDGPAPARFSPTPEKVTSDASSSVTSLSRPQPKVRQPISDISTAATTTTTTTTSATKAPVFPSLYQSKTAEPEPVLKSDTVVPKPKEDNASAEKPVKGIPSIIANRLRQTSTHPSQMANNVVSNGSSSHFLKLDSNLNDESSTDSDASPRVPPSKLPGLSSASSSSSSSSPFALNLTSVSSSSASASSASDSGSDKDTVSSEIASEIAAVRKKMESTKKSSSVAQIFDSSQLAKKRKENKQLRAAAAAAQAGGIVPPLDLSGIHEDKSKVYMPQQKEIKPCNIKFVGENAKTERSLLKKNRKVKVNIHFNDLKTETFEYPNEETALEHYLEEHPHDTEDLVFLDTTVGGGGLGESSDDVDDDDDGEGINRTETIDVFEVPVTPHGNSEDDLLKSNTSLSSSGSLQSYRGRFQEDFEFGARLHEPEPVKQPLVDPHQDDPDSMMLRPAHEEDTNTWSTSSVADLLF